MNQFLGGYAPLTQSNIFGSVYKLVIAGLLVVFGLTIFSSVAFADISFGATTTAQNGAPSVNIGTSTIAIPASTAIGDFLIAGITFNGGTNTSFTSVPSDWVPIERTDNGTKVGMITYYKIAGASEPSNYVWVINNTLNIPRMSGGIIRYTGVNTSSPIDVKSENDGDTDDPIASSVTTTQINDMVIVFYGVDDNESFGPVTSATERYDLTNSNSSGPGSAAFDFTQATVSATGDKTSDNSGTDSDQWVAQQIALKSAPTTGSLVVTKTTIGGDGTFNFTGDAGSFSITTSGNIGSNTINNLTPDNYTVTETEQIGWDETSNNCDEVEVTAGNTEDCSIINTKRGSITVHKDVVNPIDVDVSDNKSFTIHLNGSETGQTLSEDGDIVYSNLAPNQPYVITEDQDANYVLYSSDCNIALLSPGQDATCTITNKQKQGTIHVIKHVINSHGLGNKVATDFSVSINGGDPNQIVTGEVQDVLDGTVDITINPGEYSLRETDTMGYAASYSAGCDGTITSNDNAECVVTNYDLDPTKSALTIFKVVKNDNNEEGFLRVVDFPLSATDSDDNETPMTSGIANLDFIPGDYVVIESNSTSEIGYTTTFSGDCDVDGNITMEADHAYTCTITNDDIAPSLTLVKEVINDNGGTAVATDWILTASGPTGISGAGGVVSTSTFSAGTYTLSESSDLEGYTSSSWSCTNDIVVNEQNQIVLGLGKNTTCTITNNDQPATLTIAKHTDGEGDDIFNFSVTNVSNSEITWNRVLTTVEGVATTTSGAEGSDILLNTGIYNVLETLAGGWNLADVSCIYDNQSIGQSIQQGKQITVSNGDHVTCTFTNTKKGILIVKKTVINDNGGIGTANNFSFQVGNNTAVLFEEDGQNDLIVEPGTYSVMEPAVNGYTTTYDGCTNIEIVAGGEATCTITNDDIAHPIPAPAPTPPIDSGGIMGLFGVVNGAPSGQILGASVGPSGEVLGVTTFRFTRYLVLGSRGNEVIELQKILITQGFLKISAPTGYFGPLTQTAVKLFQTNHNLPPVGVVGPLTRAVLNGILTNQ